MSLDRNIQCLNRVTMFEGFSSEHLRLIAFGAEERSLPPNSLLFQEDSFSDGGYVVAEGSVRTFSENKSIEPVEHGPGSLLGELALISDINHVATARTVDKAIVLKIPRSLFRRVLEEYPELAETIQARLSGSMNSFIQNLDRVRSRLERDL